jgi:decaprenylphospho-beta-D-erythro-pentofuranosid-2-ulose 2-reductase
VNDALGQPQTVFVLGGGSDIARAVVRCLIAKRTHTVILAGRPGSASLAAAAAEATTLGAVTVETVDFDAADPASHGTVIDGVWSRHPDIDLVLVAFGVLGDQPACESDPAVAIEVATINYTGAVTVGLAAACRLRRQGHGTLVALSSVAGERVRRANFVYGSTKAGMDGFYQGLGDSLVGTGARVIVVRPGFVRSRMTEGMSPAPFATTPAAVAEAVVDALGSTREVVWVPGILRWFMTAIRHLPRAVFRKLPG